MSNCLDFSTDAVRALAERLFPIRRSITGPGIEQSLQILGEYINYDCRYSFKSGANVNGWIVPPTWNCRKATLTDPEGRVIADYDRCSLEVVNYSEPVQTTMELDSLQAFLYSHREIPDAVPYVTSYYRRGWGFCLPHEVRESLIPGRYQVFIDSQFDNEGSLPVAEAVLPGQSDREFLLTTYLCHPEMGNNELSGPLAMALVYGALAKRPTRLFTYRFVVGPETIGSVAYLSRMLLHLRARVYAGLVLTCLGGPEPRLTIKGTREGNDHLDRLARVLERQSPQWEYRAFSPTEGSDERQFASAGSRLPVGQVARTVYGQYTEYHTSADDLDFMDVNQVLASARKILDFLELLEATVPHETTYGAGEPQLGRFDLYPGVNAPGEGMNSKTPDHEVNLTRLCLEVVSRADGERTLEALLHEVSREELVRAVELLRAKDLIVPTISTP